MRGRIASCWPPSRSVESFKTSGWSRYLQLQLPECPHVLGFLSDSDRNLMVRGPLIDVGLCPRSDEEEFLLLLAKLSLLALLADEDRALVSANTSSKLALAWERGTKELSRISTNFDSVILIDRLNSVQRENWMCTRPARSGLILSTVRLRGREMGNGSRRVKDQRKERGKQ